MINNFQLTKTTVVHLNIGIQLHPRLCAFGWTLRSHPKNGARRDRRACMLPWLAAMEALHSIVRLAISQKELANNVERSFDDRNYVHVVVCQALVCSWRQPVLLSPRPAEDHPEFAWQQNACQLKQNLAGMKIQMKEFNQQPKYQVPVGTNGDSLSVADIVIFNHNGSNWMAGTSPPWVEWTEPYNTVSYNIFKIKVLFVNMPMPLGKVSPCVAAHLTAIIQCQALLRSWPKVRHCWPSPRHEHTRTINEKCYGWFDREKKLIIANKWRFGRLCCFPRFPFLTFSCWFVHCTFCILEELLLIPWIRASFTAKELTQSLIPSVGHIVRYLLYLSNPANVESLSTKKTTYDNTCRNPTWDQLLRSDAPLHNQEPHNTSAIAVCDWRCSAVRRPTQMMYLK